MSTNFRMSTVLKRILELNREYEKLPFFEFLRDDSIDPAERMAFFPGMAYFILSFGDLNKYILRKEPAADRNQQQVNDHTYEDDHHWRWYLEDYHKLGFDNLVTPTDFMVHLWSDATRQSRILKYRLTAMIDAANSIERIAIIDAIEETGNVLFKEVLGIARILEARLGTELRYCGQHHFNLESGHTMGADHREMAAIEIAEATNERCIWLIEEVFDIFTHWTWELLCFATQRISFHGAYKYDWVLACNNGQSMAQSFQPSKVITEKWPDAIVASSISHSRNFSIANGARDE
jgi:hypothetical protein